MLLEDASKTSDANLCLRLFRPWLCQRNLENVLVKFELDLAGEEERERERR